MTIGIDPVVHIVGGSGPDNWGGEEDQHSELRGWTGLDVPRERKEAKTEPFPLKRRDSRLHGRGRTGKYLGHLGVYWWVRGRVGPECTTVLQLLRELQDKWMFSVHPRPGGSRGSRGQIFVPPCRRGDAGPLEYF
jgi:hypothetical protein